MKPVLADLSGGRRFRAGMVGGGHGAFFAGIHRAAMRLTDRYDLVAGAFSSDPDNARQTGAALRIAPDRTYLDYAAMAAAEAGRTDDRLDVAIVVTPNHLHFEPCKLFLEAGIPVICDKPLTNGADEARALQEIAARNDTFLAVSYTYTGYPMVRDARERIRAGEIGEVRFLYAEYLLEWLADDPSRLGKGGIWRGDPAKAGPTGALGDVGTHAFQMLEFLSGARCTRLNARLMRTVPGFGLDDTDVVQLEFTGGANGLLWCSLAAPGHRNGLRVRIVGTEGTFEWQQEAPETLHLSRLGQGDITYRRGLMDNSALATAHTSLPPGSSEGYLEALAVLYADYATALGAGSGWREVLEVPIADVAEGLRGVLLSEASLRSAETGAWVPFPDA